MPTCAGLHDALRSSYAGILISIIWPRRFWMPTHGLDMRIGAHAGYPKIPLENDAAEHQQNRPFRVEDSRIRKISCLQTKKTVVTAGLGPTGAIVMASGGTLVHLLGPAGVGKLTIARELAPVLKARAVDNHWINNPILGLLGSLS